MYRTMVARWRAGAILRPRSPGDCPLAQDGALIKRESRSREMSEIFQATGKGDAEQALKAAVDEGLLALLRLPEQAENGFRQHARDRAAGLLHQSCLLYTSPSPRD